MEIRLTGVIIYEYSSPLIMTEGDDQAGRETLVSKKIPKPLLSESNDSRTETLNGELSLYELRLLLNCWLIHSFMLMHKSHTEYPVYLLLSSLINLKKDLHLQWRFRWYHEGQTFHEGGNAWAYLKVSLWLGVLGCFQGPNKTWKRDKQTASLI